MATATPESTADSPGARLGGYWLAGFAAWFSFLAWWLWPSFRWQIEYYRTPGEGYFYAILIVAPAVAAVSLCYGHFRGPRLVRWEPLVIAAPLLIPVVRAPWAAMTTLILLSSALGVGRWVLTALGLANDQEEAEWTLPLLTGVSVSAWLLSLAAMAGLMSQPLLWLAAALPAVLNARRYPRHWRALSGICRRWAEDEEIQGSLTGMLVPFLALAVLSGALVATAPPVAFDGLHFHLPLAQRWAQSGSLAPSQDLPYSYFPQLFEILLAWAYTIGGVHAAGAFCFALSLLGAAACWRVVRLLGGSRQAAACGLAVIASAPALHWTGSVIKNDFLMAAMQVACVACFLRWSEDRDFRWILLGAWFLGSSFGVKHSALFAGIPLGLLGLRAVWAERSRIVAFAGVGVILMSTASIWHLRAYWLAGDPAYPLRSDTAALAVNSPTRTVRNPIDRLARLLGQIHGESTESVFENILPAPAGALFSTLFPLLFLVRGGRRPGQRRPVGFVVALALAYWVMTLGNLRYALTALLLLACLSAIGLSNAYARGGRAAKNVLAAAVVYSLIFGWTGTMIIENSGPQVRYALGLMGKDAYLDTVHPSLPRF